MSACRTARSNEVARALAMAAGDIASGHLARAAQLLRDADANYGGLIESEGIVLAVRDCGIFEPETALSGN